MSESTTDESASGPRADDDLPTEAVVTEVETVAIESTEADPSAAESPEPELGSPDPEPELLESESPEPEPESSESESPEAAAAAAQSAAAEEFAPPAFDTATLPTLDPHATPLYEPSLLPGITRVICPNCQTVWEGNDLRPHAAWFCATCDFPLFWARSGGQVGLGSTDDALARLPGTAGRTALASIACPNCGEHNPPDPTANCLRCGAPLTTPEPPPPAPPPQVVVAPPVIEPRRRRIWPWIVATGVLALLAIVLLLILLFND